MKNKVYSFSTDDALEHGVDAAVILHNMRFWLDHARAHGEMIQDNYYWMFMTAAKMVELFPFWTANKIQKELKKLETCGAVITGNYNKNSWNRTKWYTMPEFCIQPNGGMGISEKAECTFSEKAESLYDQYEDSNTKDNNDSPKGKSNVYPEEFEWIWANKPQREGSNPKKQAYSACKARLKEGSTWRELAEGLNRYRAYCIAKRIVNTSMVQQMSTFFGTKESFKESWTVNHEANSSNSKSNSVQQTASSRVQAALEKQRREFNGGAETMGDHDGVLHGQVHQEERGDTFIDLDHGDWSSK